MEFRTVARPAGSFQEPVSPAEIVAMCRRVLGAATQVCSAVEFNLGTYNGTFLLDLGRSRRVVLRVAPRPERQLRSERHWLRSEYAAGPWLAGLAPLVPEVLGADFTHQVVERDYLVQTLIVGVPAPEALPGYDRAQWPRFFAQLGAISRQLHEVAGERWGALADADEACWSDALERSLADSISDLGRLSAGSDDVARLADLVKGHRDRLDVLEAPALLHGDLWTANVLLEAGVAEPTVVGVLDSERAWWGDPLADWALYRADARASADERDAFWSAYGGRSAGADLEWRRQLYRGRHLVAERVEAARLGNRGRVDATVSDLAAVLSVLA